MKKLNLPRIPILSLPDTPLTVPSWYKIPIVDITDNIVLYKDGAAALVMESSSLNFSLLSEKEQQAVVAAYAALLNSLSFPIQILIKSQRKDISSYIAYLDEATKKITSQKLGALMQNYRAFILNSVKKKNVLGKKFYIIIPFSSLELGVTKSIASAVKTTQKLPFPKSYVIKKAKIILYPKRDHLLRQSKRFGIKLIQLTNSQLINLFYNVFNPEPPTVKKEKEVGIKNA